MKQWFSGVVKGTTTGKKGENVIVREQYLIDAMGFTEAENMLVSEIFPLLQEPVVMSLKREVIEYIYNLCEGTVVWWKVIVSVEWPDVTGNEKEKRYTYMISAENDFKAREIMVKIMEGTMSDWKIVKIEATKIKDVLFYEEKKTKDELR